MRVFSCNSYCPSICSSKPSLEICSPCPLNLEDAQLVSSSPPRVSHVSEAKLSDEKIEVVKDGSIDGNVKVFLKSSLKKSPGSGSLEFGIEGKGRVKWMDYVGKELVEIREFEHSEPGSSEGNGDGDGDPACICAIQ